MISTKFLAKYGFMMALMILDERYVEKEPICNIDESF